MAFFDRNAVEIDRLREMHAKPYSIISGSQEPYSRMRVPKSFEDVVIAHVISHYLNDNGFYQPPLYLVVEGRAGEGKTSQVIATCTRRGIDVLYISASQMSGSHERDALDIIENAYQRAIAMRSEQRLVAMLIDDFHLGNAAIDSSESKTINASLLTGYMMNLADDHSSQRVPIILTGNDFSQVYAPLIRSGRANRFEWKPKDAEKYEVVRNILIDIIKGTDQEFDFFFDRYKHLSVARFAQLRNDIRKKIVTDCSEKYVFLNTDALGQLNKEVSQKLRKVTFAALTEILDKDTGAN